MDRGVYRLDTFDPYRVDTYRIEAVLQLSVSYRTSFYDSVQKKIILPTLTFYPPYIWYPYMGAT
jgi:hypothetical protein